ncbi:unnamed protein product [Urochloa decumbens]|uniref:Uncharacterized protein n=1 Tax=Urochloa decumbens TaxID=240449 RepID=A0ABC9A4S1_9POAL
MSPHRRLCIFMTLLVAAVLAAPAASTAGPQYTGATRRRYHLAPAPAPAGRSFPMPPSKAPAAHAPVSTAAPSPTPSSHGGGATILSPGATLPGTAASTQPVVTATVAPSAPSSVAAPTVLSSWAAFSTVAGGVALMLL